MHFRWKRACSRRFTCEALAPLFGHRRLQPCHVAGQTRVEPAKLAFRCDLARAKRNLAAQRVFDELGLARQRIEHKAAQLAGRRARQTQKILAGQVILPAFMRRVSPGVADFQNRCVNGSLLRAVNARDVHLTLCFLAV